MILLKKGNEIVTRLISFILMPMFAIAVLLTSCQLQFSDSNESYPINPDVNEEQILLVNCIDVNDIIDSHDINNRQYINIDLISLDDYIFIGGETIVNHGGDAMNWYIRPFGFDFHAIPGIYSRLVGHDVFMEWVTQPYFTDTNWRSLTMRVFVDYFNISQRDLIVALENVLEMSMDEIDERVNWARELAESDDIPYQYQRDVFRWSAHRFSLSDFDAIYSNDIEVIWNAFPGYGVFNNGRVYSPEWIVHNMERAIYEEQIPLDEIARVLDSVSGSGIMFEELLAAFDSFNVAASMR